jgi:hypothetical protein
MATQRYISTSFWDDEWITTLDPSEKLLYLYLMTNPLTNIAGVYQITVRRICFDTGFNSDTIGHILTKFEKAGKAYLRDGYMILPSWPQHQRPEERSKIKQGIDAILRKLPDKIKDLLVQIGYRYHIEGYPYPSNYSDSDTDTDSDTDSDSDSDQHTGARKIASFPQPAGPSTMRAAGLDQYAAKEGIKRAMQELAERRMHVH